ncbi:hypothetical protein CHARACLAT_015014 [Characodon lateralis]|uniref:Uncharacterized protein n=1 Tax=Characodon lateralis TaxID=208331 RepID=A0ABU7DR87_9TELE|nr:hypothetical protein [Characodon lateralis]
MTPNIFLTHIYRATNSRTHQMVFYLARSFGVPDEGGDSVHSPGLDSAEADFIDGIDPSHDIVDDEEEKKQPSCSPEAPSSLERGRGRSQPSGNWSCSSHFTGK